jgi:hypothetical protein
MKSTRSSHVCIKVGFPLAISERDLPWFFSKKNEKNMIHYLKKLVRKVITRYLSTVVWKIIKSNLKNFLEQTVISMILF